MRVSSKFVSGGTWVDETPSGLVNSSNTAYTLTYTPVSGSPVLVFINGIKDQSFSITGTSLSMTTAPDTGQSIRVVYQK